MNPAWLIYALWFATGVICGASIATICLMIFVNSAYRDDEAYARAERSFGHADASESGTE